MNRPVGMVVTSRGDLYVEVGDEGIMWLRTPAAAAGQVPVTAATSEKAVEASVKARL